jgi:hypothetical protein
MPRHKAQQVPEPKPVERSVSKKARGRPRKSVVEVVEDNRVTGLSNGADLELINFVKNGMSLMKIKTYR